MKTLAFVLLGLLGALGAALGEASAQDANAPVEGVGARIERGIDAAEGMPEMPDLSGILGAEADVSLSGASGPRRLRTTLDPLDIEQRIDKGLTAAGEPTTFPPDYAFGAFQRGWFLTAFSLALDRAKEGDAAAQTLLGVLLTRGLGVKEDLAAAADWYGLAGDAGDREALYALGQFYLAGQGVDQDTAKAAELFRQAADKNHPGAARELGYLLLAGNGVKQDAMLAAAYFRRAAGLGDMDAQYMLAGLYVEGVGVVTDESQAARWFAQAARNGHVGAQIEYAIILSNGRGVPKDEAGAASWLSRAAEADNPVAQVRLARVLADGLGVEADPAAAARWYLIAKNRGLEDAAMENKLEHLDPEMLKTAQSAADEWTRSRRGWLQATVAPNDAAPVDNPVE